MGVTIENAASQQSASTTDQTYSEQNCPKCKHENTQSVELIIKAGTHNITTTTSTVGVGVSSSGSVGMLSASSTTKGQSVSDLAKELSAKFAFTQSNSAGWMIIAMLVMCIGLSYFIVSLLSALVAKGVWVVVVPGVAMFVALLTVTYPRFFKSRIEREKADNKRGLELWQRWTTKGFFCHRCGHTFIPGSDEVYKPIESNV